MKVLLVIATIYLCGVTRADDEEAADPATTYKVVKTYYTTTYHTSSSSSSSSSSGGCKVDLFVGNLDKSTKDTYTSNTPHVKHDNTMSALRLQPGCCVTLFDLPNYKGASKRTCNTMNFKQLIKAFGMGWNDKVSSLQLHPACKVDLFVGHLDKSTKDTYTSNTPHVKHDNTMSALRLQPGCCVTLFDLPNYKGASKRTCNTMNFKQLIKAFGMGWNDKVSSLQLHPGARGDEDSEEDEHFADDQTDDLAEDEENEEFLDDEE